MYYGKRGIIALYQQTEDNLAALVPPSLAVRQNRGSKGAAPLAAFRNQRPFGAVFPTHKREGHAAGMKPR